jgi:hypothetical protein
VRSIVGRVDHVHDVVPVHERGHDHGSGNGQGHDHGHGNLTTGFERPF